MQLRVFVGAHVIGRFGSVVHLTRAAIARYIFQMRWLLCAFACGFSLNMAAPRALSAQGRSTDSLPPTKTSCKTWLYLQGPGGIPADSVYNKCALERAPFLLDPAGFTRFPASEGGLNALLVVVVDTTYRVNLELTRAASAPLPKAFDEDIYKTLQRWLVAPGSSRTTRAGRSAFPIMLQVPPRDIPRPALVKWTHMRSRSDAPDTMRGTWVAAAPETPMSDAQVDGIYVATIRDLVDSRVVIDATVHRYCVAFPSSDSVRAQRLNDQLRDIVELHDRAATTRNATTPNATSRNASRTRPSFSCTPGDSARRIVLGPAVRSEDNRISLSVSGDFLQLYPREIYGRTWRAWRGECTAPVPPTGAQVMHCNVENVYDRAEQDASERAKTTAQYTVKPAGGDSIRIRVIALGVDRARTDTMFATMPFPPRLADHALVASEPTCEGRQAFSAQSLRGRYLFFSRDMQGFVSMQRVRTDSAPRRFVETTECAATAARSPLTAFVLGDVGTQDVAPITTCYFGCAEPLVVDPLRHMLAEHAVLTFKPANLRQEQGQYDFSLRIDVDRAPEGLSPMAAFYFNRAWRVAYVAEPFGVNAWILGLGSDTGGGKNAPADQEVRIYFFRR